MSCGNPGAQQGCFCHGGGSQSTTATLTVTGLPTQYTPGATYTVTISIAADNLNPVPLNQGGFNIEVDNGTLQLVDSAATQPNGDASQVTHTSEGNDQRSWQVRWVAPASADAGNVTVRVAGNAVNGDGQENPADQWRLAFFTIAPSEEPAGPDAVDDLAITDIKSSFVDLEWSAPAGDPATYEVAVHTELVTEANFDAAPKAPNPPTAGAPGSAQEFTVTGLTGNTSYWFAVRALSDAGDAGPISNVVNATTLGGLTPPEPPRQFTATATDEGILLQWLAPNRDGGAPVEHYRVLRNATGATAPSVLIVQTNGTSHLDATARPGVAFRYAVSAVNSEGESLLSAIATATRTAASGDVGTQPTTTFVLGAPAVVIEEPASGATVSGLVLVSGRALAEGTVERVEVSVGGGEWEPASGTAIWVYRWDTTPLSGNVVLSVRTFDDEGRTGGDSALYVVERAGGSSVAPGAGLAAVVALAAAAVLGRPDRRR